MLSERMRIYGEWDFADGRRPPYDEWADEVAQLEAENAGLREAIPRAYWNGHTEGRLYGKASMNAKEYEHGENRIRQIMEALENAT